MRHDPVDRFIEQWGKERPDVDPSPLAVVSRILMLYKHLEHSADRALAQFGLTLWQFDVLAALRRAGPPFTLSPTRLTELVTLSSGAMTNRLDRLEASGLVRRQRDPEDRRGLLIELTPDGRDLVDRALTARLEDARRNVALLKQSEKKLLADLLRKLLLTVRSNGESARLVPPARE